MCMGDRSVRMGVVRPQETATAIALAAFLVFLLSVALLLARPALAEPPLTEPFLPYLTATFTATGMASDSITCTVYSDGGGGGRRLAEWGLQATATGSVFLQWTIDVELSNDGSTWTSILKHKNEAAAATNGSMVWGIHRAARLARLKATLIGSGVTVTATAIAEP